METRRDKIDTTFAGKAVLVVEDEYLVASMITDAFEDAGADIAGPVSDLRMALDLLNNERIRVDAATLDVKLGGEDVFPLAERLAEEGIPFVFLTGYECHFLPERFQGSPCLSKPFEPEEVVEALRPHLKTAAPV